MDRRTFTALLLATGVRGQTATPPVSSKERGRALIDGCIAALGGPAFLAMQDRVEAGRAYSFYRERLSGLSVAKLYTRYPEPPNPVPDNYEGILERQVFGKKEDQAVLYIPDGGFELTFRGARPLPDANVDRHRESTLTNILFILRQRLHEPGLEFEARAPEVVENQRVEAVDVFDSKNRQVTVYLGAESKLPVLQRYMRFDSTYKERIEELTRFAKYRDAGNGVMWPLDVQRERDGEKIYQMFSEKVSVGNNLDPSLFSLPNGIKVLKKENF